MRRSLIILVVLALLCGCAAKSYPPSIDNVDVKLLDSNASSVKLQFRVYVRGFSEKPERYNLSCSIQLANSRIELKEVKREINVSRGVRVYTFNFSFDRSRSYTVDFSISKNNRICCQYPIEITNLQSVPNLEFGVKLRGVDFQLVNLTKERAKLVARMYFVSNSEMKGIRLHLKAMPAGTSLVAEEKWMNVNFTKGLNVVETKLSLPKDYNYQLVIEAWRGDKVECTWKKPLILNPSKPKPKNETNFSLQNFVVKPQPVPTYTYVKKTPSFLAVTAILCMAALAVRRFRRA